jgi:oligoendopeptidase F
MTSIDDETLIKFLDENDNLKKYERIIKEIIKDKKHILSEKEEYIISKYSNVLNSFDNIYTMLCDVNFKFSDVEGKNEEKLKLTHATYSEYLQSNDEKIRKQAFENMYSKYKEFIEAIAENYLNHVKKCTISANLRNYESSLESALDNDDSNKKVYENLVNTVNKNLNLNHRYMKLKAKMLNLDKLHMYDVYVNPIKEKKEVVNYDDACITVKEVLQVMGKEYVD